MAGAVKGNRAYHSPLRREQAAATRTQILEAAQTLFVQHGYPRDVGSRRSPKKRACR